MCTTRELDKSNMKGQDIPTGLVMYTSNAALGTHVRIPASHQRSLATATPGMQESILILA